MAKLNSHCVVVVILLSVILPARGDVVALEPHPAIRYLPTGIKYNPNGECGMCLCCPPSSPDHCFESKCCFRWKCNVPGQPDCSMMPDTCDCNSCGKPF